MIGFPEGALPGEPANVDEPDPDVPTDDGALIEQPGQEGESPAPPADPEPMPDNAPSPSIAPTAAPPSTPADTTSEPAPLEPDAGAGDAGSAADAGTSFGADGAADAGAADAAKPE